MKFEEELSKSEYKKLQEILMEKADAIKALNDKIMNHADIGNSETELDECEENSIDLELKLQKLRERINQTAEITEGPTLQPQNESQNHRTTTETENAPPTLPEVKPQVRFNSNNTCSSSNVYHKLPKLTLASFHRDITEWQTFWDCYESSVHSNPTLSNVQKFSYLRTLLQGVAASCIAGFPLTHANYTRAVDLLATIQPAPQDYQYTHAIFVGATSSGKQSRQSTEFP